MKILISLRGAAPSQSPSMVSLSASRLEANNARIARIREKVAAIKARENYKKSEVLKAAVVRRIELLKTLKAKSVELKAAAKGTPAAKTAKAPAKTQAKPAPAKTGRAAKAPVHDLTTRAGRKAAREAAVVPAKKTVVTRIKETVKRGVDAVRGKPKAGTTPQADPAVLKQIGTLRKKLEKLRTARAANKGTAESDRNSRNAILKEINGIHKAVKKLQSGPAFEAPEARKSVKRTPSAKTETTVKKPKAAAAPTPAAALKIASIKADLVKLAAQKKGIDRASLDPTDRSDLRNLTKVIQTQKANLARAQGKPVKTEDEKFATREANKAAKIDKMGDEVKTIKNQMKGTTLTPGLRKRAERKIQILKEKIKTDTKPPAKTPARKTSAAKAPAVNTDALTRRIDMQRKFLEQEEALLKTAKTAAQKKTIQKGIQEMKKRLTDLKLQQSGPAASTRAKKTPDPRLAQIAKDKRQAKDPRIQRTI